MKRTLANRLGVKCCKLSLEDQEREGQELWGDGSAVRLDLRDNFMCVCVFAVTCKVLHGVFIYTLKYILKIKKKVIFGNKRLT